MFTVYGLTHDGYEDGHADVRTINEALERLRELIAADGAIPDGSTFSRYFLSFEPRDVTDVAQWLSKH